MIDIRVLRRHAWFDDWEMMRDNKRLNVEIGHVGTCLMSDSAKISLPWTLGLSLCCKHTDSDM